MATTPTIIGNNTWAIRLSDVETDIIDPGSWAWYLKGLVKEVWDMTPAVSVETGADATFTVMIGQFSWSMVIDDVVVKTKVDMDKIKRAVRQWNDEDKLLYLNNKLDGVDEAYWSNDVWTAATDKIKVKIIKILWKQTKRDARVCTVYLKRVTVES